MWDPSKVPPAFTKQTLKKTHEEKNAQALPAFLGASWRSNRVHLLLWIQTLPAIPPAHQALWGEVFSHSQQAPQPEDRLKGARTLAPSELPKSLLF